MKNYFFAVLFILTAWMSAMAVPAKPGFTSFRQSDGTTIDVQAIGDEFFACITTRDGLTVDRNEKGDWCYITGQGVTNIMAHNEGARTSEELAFIAAERAHLTPSSQMSETTRQLIKKVNALRKAGRVPHSGTIRVPIILVEYKDVKMKHTVSEFKAQFNTNSKSVRQYFIDQSNGLFTPQFDVFGIYTLSENREVYGGNKDGKKGDDQGLGKMVGEAIDLVQASKTITWSNYDNDKDNTCDVVIVVYAGVGEAQATTTVPESIWPCQWNLSSAKAYGDGPGTKSYSNITINDFAVFNEIRGNSNAGTDMDGIGTFCHEFSHCLSLPDFYDTTDQSAHYAMGNWSLMGHGSYNDNSRTPIGYSAFEKNWMGWLNLRNVLPNTQYTISAMNQGAATTDVAYKVTSPLNTNEYFILENRRKQGWDKYIGSEGMMIFHVTYNSDRWTTKKINTEDVQLMDIVPADNIWSRATENADAWGSTKHDFTDTSTPAATLNMTSSGSITGNAGKLGHSITDIQIGSNGDVTFWYDKKNLINVGDVAYEVISEPSSSSYGKVRAYSLSPTGEGKSSLALAIPTTVTYNSKIYDVTSVADYAFQGKTNLTSFRTYPGITTIGKGALARCTGITYAQFSSSTTSIGSEAFSGCTALKTVYSVNPTPPALSATTFPSNSGMALYVTKSSTNSADNYKKATYWKNFATISKSKYAYDIYCNDGALLVVTKDPLYKTAGEMTVVGFNPNGGKVENGVLDFSCGSSPYYFNSYSYNLVAISDSAFINDTDLKGANLSKLTALTSIGKYAFYGSNVTNIMVPKSVTNIGTRAFVNCTQLSELLLMQQSGTRSWGGQFYGGNASDFTCYVRFSGYQSYYNSITSWSTISPSTKSPSEQLNAYFDDSNYEVFDFAINHNVDWSASGLKAWVVSSYNSTEKKAYTKQVTSTPANTGVLITGYNKGQVYPLKRPAGRPSAPTNLLVGTATGNVDVYNETVGFGFLNTKKYFSRPSSSPWNSGTYRSYLKLSSAVAGSTTKITVDLFPQELKGDVDGNGVVNVSDVTALINQILGTASYPTSRCDIDGNGVVNVSDVTALINLILAQ